MRLDFDEICPIFFEKEGNNKLEQIGSGVFLEIKNNIFLLTVAHVIDYLEHGDLFIPTDDGFSQLYGHYSFTKMPKGFQRADDTIDIAYFKIERELSNSLHHIFKVLKRDDLHLTESLVDNDIYTFAGFPWRKTKSRNNVHTSEQFAYTGGAAAERKYEKLGYDRSSHIVVSFNRQKSYNTSGSKIIPPHPQGISGGGVYTWPKDIKTSNREVNLLLVGIGHTYHEKQHCLVATRINYYLANIYHNNPQLIDLPLNEISNSNNIPLIVGIAWYKEDEWERLKLEFDDSEKMHTTWNEWRQATESGIEHMHRKNKIMYPVILEADEIKAYCSKMNLPNTSSTRIKLVNEILASNVFEQEII